LLKSITVFLGMALFSSVELSLELGVLVLICLLFVNVLLIRSFFMQTEL
jgi:hypothetical protein